MEFIYSDEVYVDQAPTYVQMKDKREENLPKSKSLPNLVGPFQVVRASVTTVTIKDAEIE